MGHQAKPDAVPRLGHYDHRVAEHRLVYSTDDGDQRRRDRHGRARPEPKGPELPTDGIVRVFRERAGRGGKVVTVVRGLPGDLAAVASDLKRSCGTGGTVKDGTVEIQGDHRDKVVARLQAQGLRAKPAGG